MRFSWVNVGHFSPVERRSPLLVKSIMYLKGGRQKTFIPVTFVRFIADAFENRRFRLLV